MIAGDECEIDGAGGAEISGGGFESGEELVGSEVVSAVVDEGADFQICGGEAEVSEVDAEF